MAPGFGMSKRSVIIDGSFLKMVNCTLRVIGWTLVFIWSAFSNPYSNTVEIQCAFFCKIVVISFILMLFTYILSSVYRKIAYGMKYLAESYFSK